MDAVTDTPGSPGGVVLPKPPGALRRFGAKHPRTVDAVVAITSQSVAFWVEAFIAAMREAPVTDFVLLLAVIFAATVATYFRRRIPIILTVIGVVASITPTVGGVSVLTAAAIGAYSIGAFRPPRTAWLGMAAVAVALVGLGIYSVVVPPVDVAFSIITVVLNIVTFTAIMLIGASVRSRRLYIEAILARAADLERERGQEAKIAAAAERARIAREMHDVVSHGITVMVTLAQGASAQAPSNGLLAAQTMRQVADTGREALSDMRRLLGVLNEPGEDALRAPQPTSTDLLTLVERFRSAGMPVRWTTRNAEFTDRALTIAVHRVLQEALTNVMRHAPDASFVDASVIRKDSVVTVSVENDGGSVAPVTTGSGRGLIGMRERAASFGGTVAAGPSIRGWLVVVTFHEGTA